MPWNLKFADCVGRCVNGNEYPVICHGKKIILGNLKKVRCKKKETFEHLI
jgi:hypothetical protein